MSRLLALDQSSRITGWAVFENNALLAYGKFNLEGYETNERLVQFREEIKKLIFDYEITEAAIENIQEQNNIVTFKVLAEILGVLEELLTELKIPYETVFASSWKSSLNIKGRDRATQKRNAQAYVQNAYNIKASQDECDAISIGSHVLKKNSIAFNWD